MSVAAAFSWLSEQAWPLWLARGIDRDIRAFHEHLTHADLCCTADFRRLRVVTRQIFVFGEAARASLPGAAEAVSLGLEYLARHAGRAEAGFAWRFDLDGKVIDERRDLYDHAFVLLALASAAGALPARQAELRAEALALDTYLQIHFRHPAGGYVESLPEALPRRQNPHMHLLEACLAAYEAFDAPVFLARADELVALFLDRLFQWSEGALPEYFTEDWTVERHAGRFVIEPGHHAEWVWLLDWYRRSTASADPRIPSAISALTRFIDAHAVNQATGTLVDELWSDGTVKSGGSRLWPQTEWLKAEILRPDADHARIESTAAAVMRYIEGAPAGLWHERRHAEGGFSTEPSPASSLYHLTCAITVARRHLKA